MTKRSLSETVSAETISGTLVLHVDNPPLNVLSASVRQGLLAGLDAAAADGDVRSVVIVCEGRTGFSGADISEFGKPIAVPDLPSLIAAIAQSPKPVVVALNGRTLGGGFELALAAKGRAALANASVGLPEIKLGLVPGCNGVAQVTRIAGVETALDLVISGREVGASEALSMGLIDMVTDGNLLEVAIALSAGDSQRASASVDTDAAAKIEKWKSKNGFRLRGQTAPLEALTLIEAAATDPARDMRDETLAAFERLEKGEQSAALRHIFSAERRVRDLPILPDGASEHPVSKVGVVGAGTMGSGIATAMLTSGLAVALFDVDQRGLERGRGLIQANLDGAVKRGKLSDFDKDQALDRLKLVDSLEMLGDADLIIEAVHESMPVKLEVFRELDRVAKDGAILATNTSFLDIDAIASATGRPDRVIGMHFFSPANVMRLLEVVRGAKTSPETIRAAMTLGQRIGKISVCVGNCHGFVGNRILLPRQTAAVELMLDGASPYDIDAAMVEFGLPMGPFQMADLAGLDVGWDKAGSAGRTIEEVFCEAERFGRKNLLGYYDYDTAGKSQPSEAALKLIAEFREKSGRTASPAATLDKPALLERLLTPMLEEVGRIIDEKIVVRPSDIDVIWVHGYGWPAWRGGPSYYRDHRSA
ncbi:3-hydroxyacyl-CoA dehydrogenase [Ochrobactrum sp. XJ1]|nr:3-hydroxyacyl-CoA dehydrogenase [Ochrobactrum sp. XJ1]